jgi:hypothetical protein
MPGRRHPIEENVTPSRLYSPLSGCGACKAGSIIFNIFAGTPIVLKKEEKP